MFIKRLDMGAVGAAIATNITYIMNMFIADVWVRMLKDSEFEGMVFFYDMTVFKDA